MDYSQPSSSSVETTSTTLGVENGSEPVVRELEFREKAVSAAAAAVLSAVIVNPLDVAKTRLQAQASPNLRHSWPRVPGYYGAPQSLRGEDYKGTWDVMRKVSSQEGVLRLWRGTNAALIIAVPMVGIYLPLYDILRERIETGSDGQSSPLAPFAPLLAGSLSRSLAVIVCSPLELARTRMQAQKEALRGSSVPGLASIFHEILSTTRDGPSSSRWRVGALWTGVGAQLARDVPFSAICWSSLEPARRQLLNLAGPEPTFLQIVGANFGAGMMAGSLAAAVTTPLDVAKTWRQIERCPVRSREMSTIRTLLQVYREQGYKGLFTGLVPRVGRAAPSVGMVVSSYEIVKHLMRHQELTRLP